MDEPSNADPDLRKPWKRPIDDVMLSTLAQCDAAEVQLPATRQSSSHHLQWQSVLARTYVERPNADEFTTLPTANLLVVMITGGMYAIEGVSDGRWRSTVYRPGSTGITAPGNASTLRWRAIGSRPLTSLQVYLAPELFAGVRAEDDDRALDVLPDALAVDDPVISTVTCAIGWALESKASSLYADSAAQFLAAHVVERHLACRSAPRGRGLGGRALANVVGYMQDNLADEITLEQLAAVAGLSKHHFLRSFKTATGATPHGFLVEIRMQRAAELLVARTSTVSWVAARCGYRSASHFAAAFHKHHGTSPTAYRTARVSAR
jgi:AraC family transcriptional regulator